MKILIIFFIFLYETYSLQLQYTKQQNITKRFDVHNPSNYIINETILRIIGEGIMNDCKDKWNENIQNITHLIIEETVKTIGNKCFSEMKQIERVELKEGIYNMLALKCLKVLPNLLERVFFTILNFVVFCLFS